MAPSDATATFTAEKSSLVTTIDPDLAASATEAPDSAVGGIVGGTIAAVIVAAIVVVVIVVVQKRRKARDVRFVKDFFIRYLVCRRPNRLTEYKVTTSANVL